MHSHGITQDDLDKIREIIKEVVREAIQACSVSFERDDFEKLRPLIEEALAAGTRDERRRVMLASGNIPTAIHDLDRRITELNERFDRF